MNRSLLRTAITAGLALCARPAVSEARALTVDLPSASVTFRDVTVEAGIHHVQRQDSDECNILLDPRRCEIEFMTGGVAVGDINRDGWPDLYFTRLDGPDSLYWNRRDGTFAEVSEWVGLGESLQTNGAAFADIDNDGDEDLFVTVVGDPGDPVNNRHRLYINEGGWFFREQGVERGASFPVSDGVNGWSIAFGDINRDGWVDLSITQWAAEISDRSRLLLNRGPAAPGFFEDVTDTANASLDGVFAFASTFADLDGDGWQDLAVAGDFFTSRLFWNNGDGTFLEGTRAAGVGTDENGMGSTLGDFDFDGDLDWFVTSIDDPFDSCRFGGCLWGNSGNRLYRNDGGRVFRDATDFAGVRDGAWGWGAAFADLDNDRDLDLVQTNGVLFPNPLADPFRNDATRLWINHGNGEMEERALASGLDDTGSGKGVATLDYDRDGDLDLIISQNSDSPRLFRNDSRHRNSWLQLHVRGRRSTANAIGAIVRVTPSRSASPMIREVGADANFLSQSERVMHFGLGRSRFAEVEVTFPATGRRVVRRVRANQRLTIGERAFSRD